MSKIHYSELENLSTEWSKLHPHRAKGGVFAIQGFLYQFQVYLLRSLEQWLKLESAEKNDPNSLGTYLETLSDVLNIDSSGAVIATQIKLTAGYEPFESAIAEFVTIYEVAESINWTHKSKIKFKLNASHSKISNIEKYIKNRKEKAKGSELAVFEKLTFEIESSPMEKMLTLLAANFPINPMEGYTYLMGLVLRSFKEEVSLTNQIWGYLVDVSKKDRVPSRLHFWTHSDIPPKLVTRGKVLSGQKPLIKHLREGYFKYRVEIYDEIFKEIVGWMGKIHQERSDKIPTFWIVGSSGSGKSVTLLQMLAKIYSELNVPVIYGERDYSSIPTAIKLSKSYKGAVVSFDDPYPASMKESLRVDWRDSYYEFKSQIESSDLENIPYLIYCSPSEHAQDFERDLGEMFSVTRFDLPRLDQKDCSELVSWYKDRTGFSPKIKIEENTLMVQLFYNLVNDIHSFEDFARRFRDRISAGSLKLYKVVVKILAMNRLYAGYPKNAIDKQLTEEEKNLLIKLEREQHFGYIDYDSKGETYWILHPHISNVLYLSWIKDPNESEAIINSVIEDCENYGESIPLQQSLLWALAKSLTEYEVFGDLKDRLKGIDVKRILIKKYNKIISTYGAGNVPIHLLPVWLQVEINIKNTQTKLSPSPLEISLSKLSSPTFSETGFRLLCHKMLQAYRFCENSVKERIFQCIFSCLNSNSSWSGWAYVWLDFAKITKRKEVFKVLDIDPGRASAYFISAVFIEVSDDKIEEDDLPLKYFIRSMKRDTKNSGWVNALEHAIRTQRKEIVPLLDEWLALNDLGPFMVFLIFRLLKHDFSKYKELAIEWARLFHKNANANFVLEEYLKHDSQNEEMLKLALRWLQEFHNKDSTFILEILLASHIKEDVREISQKWIISNYNSTGWKFVFKAHFENFQDNHLILQSMENWLKDSENQQQISWGYVWREYNRFISDEEKSNALGLNFLKSENDNEVAAQIVWVKLIKGKNEKEFLIEKGLRLLKTIDLQNKYGINFYKELHNLKETPEVINFGLEYVLNKDEFSPTDASVFYRLLKTITYDSKYDKEIQIQVIAKFSLIRNKEFISHRSTIVLLSRLMEHEKWKDAVLEQAIYWLENYDNIDFSDVLQLKITIAILKEKSIPSLFKVVREKYKTLAMQTDLFYLASALIRHSQYSDDFFNTFELLFHAGFSLKERYRLLRLALENFGKFPKINLMGFNFLKSVDSQIYPHNWAEILNMQFSSLSIQEKILLRNKIVKWLYNSQTSSHWPLVWKNAGEIIYPNAWKNFRITYLKNPKVADENKKMFKKRYNHL